MKLEPFWILGLIAMGLWLIYWLFARPTFLLASRMELFRIRNILRMSTETECPSLIRKKLEAFCNGSLRCLSTVDISDLIIANRRGDEVQARRDIEDVLNSTPLSKDLFERMVKTVLASTVASSALLLIPALAVLGLAVWFSYFRKLISFAKQRMWFFTVYGVEIKPPKMAPC